VRQQALEGARKALAGGAWAEARALADRVLAVEPDNAEAAALRQQADTGEERQLKDLQRARDLLARARDRDTGAFDQRALEWTARAERLAPADQEIAALYASSRSTPARLRCPAFRVDRGGGGGGAARSTDPGGRRDVERVAAIDKRSSWWARAGQDAIIELRPRRTGARVGSAPPGAGQRIQLRHRSVATESSCSRWCWYGAAGVALADARCATAAATGWR
jgi:hypothetical protein